MLTKEEIEELINFMHHAIDYLQSERDGLIKFIETKIRLKEKLRKRLEET